ncbi:MAG: NAD(+) diphosphatase [Aestuariivirga sp.]|uniref:NAD(+) diphosphatase n=1 Tax=Aestuariivirga sp. TaxID=2650926 RepID=UPI0025C4317C|nr:NAD(+) diphosphatase [Aestuariivirga sp.]MCA3561967.1 NAD(+) diphosphatase [Aestuariivirga sp.]
MPLAYVLNPLDRRANDRPNAAWVAAQRKRADAKLIRIAGDGALLSGGRLVTDNDAGVEAAVFLGLDAVGAPWFAADVAGSEGMRGLRSLAMEETLPPEQLGMLAQARSLLQWHARRTYCSNCAAKLEMADAGYRRHCPGCGMDHFPRTDPVAIMVVRHEGNILLGRQSSWKPGMYSALAGFVEPGETIEDAARREVFEESGVRVGAVRYVTSQPWPFLSNLMIGLIGEALSAEITIDTNELEDARWFSAGEARMMMERRHPGGLYAANPMAIAHELVRVALEE